MQPSEFLASLERHKAELAAQPDPQEEFAKAQFQAVIDTVTTANKALLTFLKSFSPSVSVSNVPDSIKTPDVAEVTKAIKALEKALKPVSADNSDIVSAIKQIQLQPVYKPEITVSPRPLARPPLPLTTSACSRWTRWASS